METSRIIKKTTLETINLDKAVDVTVVIEDIVTQIQNNAQKNSEKETQQVDLSWTSDTVNAQVDVQ